jgi:hypothetical protein
MYIPVFFYFGKSYITKFRLWQNHSLEKVLKFHLAHSSGKPNPFWYITALKLGQCQCRHDHMVVTTRLRDVADKALPYSLDSDPSCSCSSPTRWTLYLF